MLYNQSVAYTGSMTERPPAPGSLALVETFLNTNDLENGTDELSTPESLGAWLLAKGLPAPEAPTAHDVARVTAVREALRDLLEANHSEPRRPPATGLLEEASAAGRLVTRFDPSGQGGLEATAGGLDGALGTLLARVYTAMADGTWARMKVCGRDRCRWAFYDHSKNRSGTWCSMASCGNKEKAAAFRRRKIHS